MYKKFFQSVFCQQRQCRAICVNNNPKHLQHHRNFAVNSGIKYKTNQQKIDLSVETDALYSIFPDIHHEIINEQLAFHGKFYPELAERYSELLNHTVNLEPMHVSRAIFCVHAYRLLEKPLQLTEENLRKACILGWAHKLQDAFTVVLDDIHDESVLRYNKSPWHALENVGPNRATLDATFLLAGAHYLLLKHFSSHPQYYNIHKTSLDSFCYINVAQLLELQRHSLEDMERRQNYLKFSHYTFPLLSSALYLANIDDRDVHLAVENYCIELSTLQKMDDDVNGIFKLRSEIHKDCTDILQGRTSWLAVEAYKRSTKTQRKILEEHFGRNNQDSLMQVRTLFEDLKLKEAYNELKHEMYKKMLHKIHNDLPKTLPPQLFINLLDFIMSGQHQV